MVLRPAPEWQTTHWLNTKEPLSLEKLRGRVVLLACVPDAVPGLRGARHPAGAARGGAFAGAPLTVVGLHTVFEHHEAMQLPS
jgi:hypothetical protein